MSSLAGFTDGRLFAKLDERVNLKRVYKQAEFVARMLTVSTFMDDALRMVLEFYSQKVTMEILGFSEAMSAPLLLISILVQTAGAFSVIAYVRPGAGCILLLCWCLWHPVMYQQLKNAEFVVETLSIMGGLLILLAHLSLAKATRGRLLGEADGEEVKRAEERVKRLGLLGRTLLVALFLYSGWTRGHRFMTNRVYAHVEIASWVARCAEGVLGLGLLGLCALVVLGMRSRFCALMMACLNFISNMFLHPFWIYMFSDSYYKFPEVMESLDDTRMQNYPMTSELYASHQRYFFFQSMSYTGALLLLVVHGPGQYSIDEPDRIELASLTSKGRD